MPSAFHSQRPPLSTFPHELLWLVFHICFFAADHKGHISSAFIPFGKRGRLPKTLLSNTHPRDHKVCSIGKNGEARVKTSRGRLKEWNKTLLVLSLLLSPTLSSLPDSWKIVLWKNSVMWFTLFMKIHLKNPSWLWLWLKQIPSCKGTNWEKLRAIFKRTLDRIRYWKTCRGKVKKRKNCLHKECGD